MRIFFCTTPKAGSQWFRDLLCNHLSADAVPWRHRRHANREFNVVLGRWPEPEEEEIFYGPIYQMEPGFVADRIRPEDRVFCVVRDPRDLAVSWMWSTAYSHMSGSPSVDLQRPILRALPLRLRIRLALARVFGFSRFQALWVASDDPRILVLRYEDLIKDTAGLLARCYEHAGTTLPDRLVRAIVDHFSFRRRAGRTPGKEDVQSHHRKGVAGDWRNYLDRELGDLIERIHPGLLANLGYEDDEDWWRVLPEQLPALREEDATAERDRELDLLNRQVEGLERRNRELQREADARLEVIEGLKRAADERLEIIERLQGAGG